MAVNILILLSFLVYEKSAICKKIFCASASFWMLDAILEYATTGHIPSIFVEEKNRHKGVKRDSSILEELPKRMENSHLSQHSKVVESETGEKERFRPMMLCPVVPLATPNPLNETALV